MEVIWERFATGKPLLSYIMFQSEIFDLIFHQTHGLINFECLDLHSGVKTAFEPERFMNQMRVCEVEGTEQFCVRDKELAGLSTVFGTRYELTRKGKFIEAIEILMVNKKLMLVLTNTHLYNGI